MVTVKHKFRDFVNKQDIETLILGTFNPDAENNEAEFFYGRGRNYFWNLLPSVFKYKKLKTESVNEKIKFLDEFKIGIVDLIQEINVDAGNETNYADEFIDNKVTEWLNFESMIKKHPCIKVVLFTRKTFSGIPNMKRQIAIISQVCDLHRINFYCLPTPARFENDKKLDEWISIFNK